MGDDPKTVGIIIGKLDGIERDVREIREGKSLLCRQHTERLDNIEGKVDTLISRPPQEPSLDCGPVHLRGYSATQIGRLIAVAMLAYIFLHVIGVPLPTWRDVSAALSVVP